MTAGGMATDLMVGVRQACGQQNPNDPTVFHNATNDANNNTTTFNGGADNGAWNQSSDGLLPAGTAPTAGYAYVVTGSDGNSNSNGPVVGGSNGGQLRTPNTFGSYNFGGDSLTIIPFDAQANLYNPSSVTNPADYTAGLFYKGFSGQQATVNDLVLANGGAVIDFNNTDVALNGNICFVPAGTTLDGITTTMSGGILDPRQGQSVLTPVTGAPVPGNYSSQLTVNATFSGAGQAHVIETYNGGSYAPGLGSGAYMVGVVVFNSSNPSFTGGVNLDNTVPFSSPGAAGTSPFPLLEINKPAALGTGTFTVTSIGAGPTISNGTGAAETISTNMPMQWNGSFQFGYNAAPSTYVNIPGGYTTSPLNLGTGTATLGANVTLTVNASTLTLAGNIVSGSGGLYTLSTAGAGTLNITSPLVSVPLNVSAGSVAVTSGNTVLTGLVTIGGTGSLELYAPASVNNLYNVLITGGTFGVAVGGAGQFAPADFTNFISNFGSSYVSGSTLAIDTALATAPFTVADNLSGAFGLQKVGAGTLTLTGSNSYAGTTTISAGTLRAGNGTSSFGTGPVTVGGGVLSGSGATGTGTVTVNATGTITAGTGATTADTVGTLTVGTGGLVLNGGAYAVKVTPGNGTPAADELVITGPVSATATLGLTVSPVELTSAGTFGPGQYAFVIADAQSNSSTGVNNAGAFTSLLSSNAITLTGGGSSYTDALGTYTLATATDGTGGQELLLDFTSAAPEPTSLLLAGLAGAPLALGRRRGGAASRCRR